jgi:hypothetical protein
MQTETNLKTLIKRIENRDFDTNDVNIQIEAG